MEEAKNAIRNLNGIKIRDKSLNVFFAKYDKKGLLWNGPFPKGEEKFLERVGREDKSLSATVNGRSFKEIVKGLPHYLKVRR